VHLELHCDDSTRLTPLFQLASKGRHTWSHPQLPLATPEADPQKIIRRGKTPQEGTSATELGDSGNFQHPSSETPLVVSHTPILSPVGVSRALNFGSFPVDFSSPGLGLEGESFDTPISPEVVPWPRPRTLGDFPTPGFIIPPPVRVVAGETSVPPNPADFVSHTQLFPFSPSATVPASPV
jgi:hypothetical protein